MDFVTCYGHCHAMLSAYEWRLDVQAWGSFKWAKRSSIKWQVYIAKTPDHEALFIDADTPEELLGRLRLKLETTRAPSTTSEVGVIALESLAAQITPMWQEPDGDDADPTWPRISLNGGANGH